MSKTNLLNAKFPVSLYSGTVYDFSDDTLTIGSTNSGDSVTAYAVFDLGLLKDDILYGDVSWYSRKLVNGEYVDIELEWTGSELVEKG